MSLKPEMAVVPVCHPQNDLGEGPLWCPVARCLYWTDIRQSRLHRFDPATGRAGIILAPDWIGALARLDDGRLLTAGRKHLWLVDPMTGTFEPGPSFDEGDAALRSNEGATDPAGRFWFATMNDAERAPTGSLYCFSGGKIETKMTGITVPNALTWSPDGRTLYFSDSWIGDIWAHDFDVDTGRFSNARVFLGKRALPGSPDGAALDSHGCLWNVRYKAGLIARLTPEGDIDRVIETGTSKLTALAFGGSDLKDLYVTSARQKTGPDRLRREPDAGALFQLRVDVAGLPEPAVKAASIAFE